MYYLAFLFGSTSFFIKDKKSNLIYATVFFAFILILAIFRYGVGTDYFIYERLYFSLLNNPISEFLHGIPSQEIGYRIIGSIFRMLNAPYSLFVAAIAIVNLVYVYKLSIEFSDNPFLSIFMYYAFYYFVWTYSGLRQGLTLTIGMYYLLKFSQNNHRYLFILVILLLSLIHISVLILIPLYFLSKIQLTRRVFLISIMLTLFMMLTPLLLPLDKLLELPFISLGMKYKLNAYINADYNLINLFDFKFIVRYLYLLIIVIYFNVYAKNNNTSKFIMTFYFFSILLYFSLQYSEIIAARFSLYGKYLDIVIYANIYSYAKNKWNKIFLATVLIIYTSLFFQKELQNMNSDTTKTQDILVPYSHSTLEIE